MKVLMFGWEFPPHISGGLGTACFGLTQSLIKQKVKVLFVVPRVYGDETAPDTVLINASAVRNPQRGKKPPVTGLRWKVAAGATDKAVPAFRAGSAMTYIEVSAGFSPYDIAEEGLAHRRWGSLRSWNYSVSGATAPGVEPMPDGENAINRSPAEEDDDYIFSGTYGRNLLEEVERYSEVGGMLARQYRFDVIHAHDWMTFGAGIRAKHQARKPLVIHVHSTEIDRAGNRGNPNVSAIEKKGFMEADRIIAVSNWTKRIIATQYDIPEEKIHVVHNGILPKEERSGAPFPEIASHFVTFLGRVTHQKGPAFFVEAAHKVLEEFPEAHFIVAGAGDLLPQIIRRVAQLNMSANFHFTGFLSGSQVDQVWSMTDVYVMPSVSEPFGIAPLEAIQGGVPVILSNQSGVSEVMPHAIKVDFWNVKALAGAICSVLRYESLSTMLRHHSKRHIRHLTWDKAALDVKALYHDLCTKQQ